MQTRSKALRPLRARQCRHDAAGWGENLAESLSSGPGDPSSLTVGTGLNTAAIERIVQSAHRVVEEPGYPVHEFSALKATGDPRILHEDGFMILRDVRRFLPVAAPILVGAYQHLVRRGFAWCPQTALQHLKRCASRTTCCTHKWTTPTLKRTHSRCHRLTPVTPVASDSRRLRRNRPPSDYERGCGRQDPSRDQLQQRAFDSRMHKPSPADGLRAVR